MENFQHDLLEEIAADVRTIWQRSHEWKTHNIDSQTAFMQAQEADALFDAVEFLANRGGPGVEDAVCVIGWAIRLNARGTLGDLIAETA